MQRIRWPRSFSVFSGSDSDSDGHVVERHNRSRKPNLHVDTADMSASSNSESASSVMGVYLFCSGDQVDLSSLQTPLSPPSSRAAPTMGVATVSPSDAIWTSTPLSISSLIGVPLLMRRLLAKPSSSLPPSPHFDNELASQLQIDASHQTSDVGSAGAASRGVGTVLVVRVDRAPLHQDLLERICAFHAKLLSMAHQRGRGSMAEIVKTWATPDKFLAFCTESYQSKSSAQISSSIHEMLNGSWLEVQQPIAAV